MKSKIISFIKLICIVYLIIFLPQIIWNNANSDNFEKKSKLNFISSIENFINNKHNITQLKNYRLCLITDEKNFFSGKKNFNQLIKNGFNIKKILVPDKKKHSISNNLHFPNNQLSKHKILNPISNCSYQIPSFKWNIHTKNISSNFFKDVDVLLFNVQGLCFTNDLCFNTLKKTMSLALNYKKKLIILDEPNFLGKWIEGTGIIPIRHGLTVGELAHYFNKYYMEKTINLTVISMVNWQRNNPLIKLNNKPNYEIISILNNSYLYTFLKALNYIKPINIGIDQKLTYQIFSLQQKNQLSEWELKYLKKLCLKLGLFCKHYSFLDKNSNISHRGLKIKIQKKINKFSAFNSFLTIARFLKNRKNINLLYSSNFDEIFGCDHVRNFLQDLITFDDLKFNIENNLNNFYSKAKSCFLYKPFPQKVKVKIVRC
ncbi:exo-beta-N-acetylmuramidase NamZ domain-containing protein [Candidatus Dependentiae bacterium]